MNIHLNDKLTNLLMEAGGMSITRPTIADVITWLYLSHDIWINSYPYDADINDKKWNATVSELYWGDDEEIHCSYRTKSVDTPVEAYFEAIEYVLAKLLI